MKIDKDRFTALKNEVVMAEKLNQEELEPIINEAIERYTGWHIPAIGRNWDIILNEVYPIIQNELPSIFFRNPRAYLKPRNKTFIAKKRNPVSGSMEEVQLDSTKSARTQEAILNYCMTEINYKREARKVLLDALLFPHGVLWHGYKGDFGMTEEQSIFIKKEQVFVKRLNPLRFIFDPSVTMSTLDEGKWVGRIIDMPLQDLIEDEKLDVDKSLKGFLGFGDRIGTATAKAKNLGKEAKDYINVSSLNMSLINSASDEFKKSAYSKFVRVYEIFLRPTKKEIREGIDGYIVLYTDEQEKPLRVSEWKIKAEGFPAIVLQFNELNDNLFGMPDIDAYKSVADQKNAITNLQLRNAQENSKVWVGLGKGSATEEEVEHIRRGEQSIIIFEGDTNPRDRMFVASPGGTASSELYLIDQRIQKNLEDKSGVSDLKRGFLQSGEESAASVKIRAAGGGARPAYRQDLMADFLKESLHYLNQLNKQYMPFTEAVRIVGSLDLEWSENPSKEELQADVDVEIDVISMLPENPEKELRELNTILALAVQALQSPEIRQKLLTEGKTINLAPLIEQILLRTRIRDPEIFRNIKPEESQGFVSVQQIREAKQNVSAALQGQQLPFPPKQGDDHVAKLEIYTSIAGMLQQMGQISDALNQLVQVHTVLLQQLQEKEAKPNQSINLKKPTLDTVGTM